MKRQCDFVERMLRRKGIQAETMHSDKDQQQREEALARFRQGVTTVLVATDVAARGLDIKGVSLVVNYDSANSTEDRRAASVAVALGRSSASGGDPCSAPTLLGDGLANTGSDVMGRSGGVGWLT